MKDIDAFEVVYLNDYEAVAKDYKEQRDLLLQENAELVGKVEQLTKERDAAVGDLRNEANCYGDLCYFCTKNGKGLCEKCRWEWRGIDEN